MGFTEKSDFLGGGSQKTNIEGKLPKKGALEQFGNLRGGGVSKKEGVVFLRGVDTPMYTALSSNFCNIACIQSCIPIFVKQYFRGCFPFCVSWVLQCQIENLDNNDLLELFQDVYWVKM